MFDDSTDTDGSWLTAKQLLFRSLRVVVTAAALFASANINRSAYAEEVHTAVIADSDGYTNVRTRPTKESPVVTRVLENQPFTVFPSDSNWWRVRTPDGQTGFMHRSCVRFLGTDKVTAENDGEVRPARPDIPSANLAPKIAIGKDDATQVAWKRYSEAMEAERTTGTHPDAHALLPRIQAIELGTIDPTVAALVTDTQSYLRRAISGNAQVAEEQRRLKPTRDTYEALRSPARSVGATLMPATGVPESYRQGTGEAIGELLLLYCFSDQLRSKNLPDTRLMILEGDQLAVRESLINASLGLEQPPGLKRWLSAARNRSYAERLLTGQWVCHNADGGVYDLEFKTNDVLRAKACGFVTLKARGRPRGMFERDFFKWQFDGDDFFMIGAGMMDDAQGVDPRKLRGVFIAPDVFKVFDENGKLIGTWTH